MGPCGRGRYVNSWLECIGNGLERARSEFAGSGERAILERTLAACAEWPPAFLTSHLFTALESNSPAPQGPKPGKINQPASTREPVSLTVFAFLCLFRVAG